MSLKGSIKGEILQGNINRLHELRGYSAYEVAVLEGFEGTKEEWLASLKGNKGDKGDTGNPGVYLGSGDMPADCNVQIDPNGESVTIEEIKRLLGIAQSASGSVVSLNDSANASLMGLKLYGKTTQNGTPTPDAPVALENAGEDGSVTVKVTGKNLINMNDWVKQGAATIAEDGSYHTDNMTMYNTYGRTEADKYMYIPENGNVPITWTITYKKDSTDVNGACFGISFVYTDGTKENYSVYGNIVNGVSEWATKSFSSNPNKTIKLVRYVWATYHCWVKEFQMEFGTTATEYEPYKGTQTLTIPTPNGLGDGEVLEVDASKLHTYKPNTTITNNYGADMKVEYVADTKTYIDNKFAELASAIVNNA